MNALIKPQTHVMSSAGATALLEAVEAELSARGRKSNAAVAATVDAMLPCWLDWDARGGFEEGADCAALFAAWEREAAQ